MTDKKFTDEDIISSLEVIATTGNCNECNERIQSAEKRYRK